MSNGKDKTIQVNNASIRYDDAGVGHLPVMFIHGFPFDKTMWEPQMDFFKSTGQAQFLQNNMANSGFYSIENAGHLSNLEQPDEFNRHMNTFLSEIQK